MEEMEEKFAEVMVLLVPVVVGLIMLIGMFLTIGKRKTKEDSNEKLSPEDEIRKLQKQPLGKRYKRG